MMNDKAKEVNEYLSQDMNQKHKKKPRSTKKTKLLIPIIFSIVLGVSCFYLAIDSFNVGVEALSQNYKEQYNSELEKTYEFFYQNAFDRAEENYHLANRMTISISDLEEVDNLEVIKASDVEFITEDRDNNSGNITAWLEVTGEGTFIINLRSAEFIVDDVRRYVLVRVPYPELTNITIIETTKRWFKDDWKNGSYSLNFHDN